MKQRTTLLGLALILGAGATLAGASRPNGPDTLVGDPARGRRVYVQKSCVDCHAVMGRGGKIGPDLATVGKGRSHNRLVAKLWDHLPLMADRYHEEGLAWPTINPGEMEDLSVYLFYLNFFDRPGDFGKGKKAFADKLCITCHSIGGQGARVGPALDSFGANSSPLKIVSRMWSHGPTMVRSQKERKMKVPRFEGAQVADILAYLQGASLEPVAREPLLMPGDPGRGRAVFAYKQCGLCHPVAGEGAGTGPDLARMDMRYSVSEYAGILWNHGPMIWEALLEQGAAIQPFTSEEMSDLLAYLYFLDYYGDGGDLKRGEVLVRERGCVACHAGPDDEPGPDGGPALVELGSVVDPNEFAAAVWNHGPAMIKRLEQKDLSWPTCTEEEMRDITAYLRAAYRKSTSDG
jgi:mono/diheme cytochrome c family protein